jgi:hypothetical protein
LATILVQWSPVVNNLNKVGGQVQTLKTLVGEDISELEGKILDVDARLGLVQGGFEDCGTVWDALSQLKSMLADLTGKVADVNRGEIDRLSGRVDQLVATLWQELDTKVQKCLDDVQVAFDGVAEALRTLGTEQARLTEMVLQQPGRDSTLGGDLGQLSARLKLVENRLPSVQGRLGGESFQSRMDVSVFVESFAPSNCFYLYHDVVTLMEFLTTSHVERKDVLQEWYQSTKVGVNEASARHTCPL